VANTILSKMVGDGPTSLCTFDEQLLEVGVRAGHERFVSVKVGVSYVGET
jgi:hypothetical protein